MSSELRSQWLRKCKGICAGAPCVIVQPVVAQLQPFC
jgi:hypothetical protein